MLLKVPLTKCDTVEQYFEILQDVSRETSTSIRCREDGGAFEADFNSRGGGTVKKTKDHELGVREILKDQAFCT